MNDYIQQRAENLKKVVEEHDVALVGVFAHYKDNNDGKYKRVFDEGKVLEVNSNFIIIDVRKTLKKKLADRNQKIPGILVLELEKYNSDSWLLDDNKTTVFITD